MKLRSPDRFLRYIVCCAVSLASSVAVAQPSLTITPIDTTAFPTLSTYILALDDLGKPIDPLSASDFAVLEDGTSRSPLSLTCPPPSPSIPISSVLTVDVSGSMALGGPNIDIAKAAAHAWVEFLPADQSECAVTSFDDYSYLNHDFTGDRSKLDRAIDQLSPQAGTCYDSALAQSLVGAVPIAAAGRFKRLVVLLTDGYSEADEDRIVGLALASNVTIHCVVVGIEAPEVLRRISARTGGFCFGNIRTAEEAERVYRAILEFTLRGGLCRLSWESVPGCSDRRSVTVSIPERTLSADATYLLPSGSVIALDIVPPGVAFSGVAPGGARDTIITMTARSQPITVTGMTPSDPRFTIVSGGAPPAFTLMPGESRSITVRYTPTDSDLVYGNVYIETDLCDPVRAYVAGGFPGRPPTSQTLTLLQPNGGEEFGVGSDTTIRWSGVLPDDTVRLEYSTDAGATWRLVADRASDLAADWHVPGTPSGSCLMRVTQLSRDSVVEFVGHTEQVLRAFFSFDGRRIVTAGFDGTARIWDAYTGAELLSLPHTARVRSAGFSRDGQFVITGCTDGAARIWSATTGALVQTLRDPASAVGDGTCVEFSPDGLLAVTSGIGAKPDNDAEIWDTKDGTLLRRLQGHNSYVTNATFSPDGTRIATSGGYDLTVKIWDAFTGSELSSIGRFPSIVHCVNWSADGKYLVVASMTVQIWDASAGTLVRDLGVGGFWANFSPDGTKIVVSTYDVVAGAAHVGVWDVVSGTLLRTFQGAFDGSWCTNFNPAGTRIVSAEIDNTARVWNLEPEPIQSDTSDALWSIVATDIATIDVDLGRVSVGAVRDSVVGKYICNRGSIAIDVRAIRFVGADAGDFALVSGQAPFRLAPGECRSLEFRFRPSTSGDRAATVEIVTSGDTLRRGVRGVGVVRALEVVSGLIDFGRVNIGDQKDTVVAVVLRNVSSDPVVVDRMLELGPDTAQFSVLDGGGGFTLQSGESRRMELRFRPGGGGRAMARLGFDYGSTGSPAVAVLFGEGVCSDLAVSSTVAFPLTVEANAGDVVTIPLSLADTLNLSGSGAREFVAVVRCNPTLLLPLDTGISEKTVDGQRLVTIHGEWDGTSDHLIDLHFLAALGDMPESPLKIDLFAWSIDCPIASRTIDGTFRLLDLCREGEGARLFLRGDSIVLKPSIPDPASDVARLEFQLIEPGPTRLTVVDLAGRLVATPVDAELRPGRYDLPLDVSDYPPGTYVLRLETPTATRSRTLRVSR